MNEALLAVASLFLMDQSKNQLWAVIALVGLFIVLGFVYKYTLSPYVGDTETGDTASHGASTLPLVSEIGRAPDDLPPPVTRTENTTVKVALEAIAVSGALADGVTYEYWTYNRQVPGPFIRVLEGDTVEVSLFHNPAGHSHTAFDENDLGFALSDLFGVEAAYAHGDEEDVHAEEATTDAHAPSAGVDTASAHATHSVDLHAVLGPGGGAVLTQAKDGETKTFAFKALRPGLYVYHCASPHVPTHIANGMYGLILVEPKSGLPKVDREFYVMQGELYTKGKFGEKGLQQFDLEKLDAEHPEYFVMNGRVGSLTGDRALAAKTGETIRIFFGVGTFVPSNFHVIGGIFDKLYPEGDIVSQPHRNVQTTLVPAGGSAVVEMKLEVPGKLLLVDHALMRAIDKGAVGELVVEGVDHPELFRAE